MVGGKYCGEKENRGEVEDLGAVEVLGGAGHHMKQGSLGGPERSWEFSCVAGAERVLHFQALRGRISQKSHVTNSAQIIKQIVFGPSSL